MFYTSTELPGPVVFGWEAEEEENKEVSTESTLVEVISH
jgi:hypothetical protein